MWQKVKNFYHLGIAIISNFWFEFPSRKLTVIGVTGTDGKTTTTSLIYHILNTAGYNTSMISSVGAIIGGNEYDVGFHVTTPSPFSLQKFIKKISKTIKNNERAYLVLETTSHALDQYRVFGIKYKVGVLTNVTHEHFDYHKTYENYLNVKAKLLEIADIAITNKDDKSYSLINEKLKMRFKNKKLITYGLKKDAEVNPKVFSFKSDLMGEFNKYNILAAIAACRTLGVKDEIIRIAIKSFKPPKGRGDLIYKNSFSAMIDFAHTPNAFEMILSAVRPLVKGRIIHVFGSAGLRDKTKRPLMGKISSKYSNVIILTAEDPRTEVLQNIYKDIEEGISKSFKRMDYKNYKNTFLKNIYFKIDDRKEAIQFAVNIAQKDDLVITTGKSHEKSMNFGHGEVAWDEYAAMKTAIGNKKK